MERNRTSSLRFKRKPLSDCTNNPLNHPSSKLISQSLLKPPKKPSNLAPITNNTTKQKNNQTPNFNLINNHVIVSNSSAKSGTSTGSNNSPNSNSVQSQAGDIVCRKSGPPATLTQRQGEQTRKDKGKSVKPTQSVRASPIVEASAYLAPQAIHISSSAISGNGGHVSRLPSVENREKDEQKRKDKGKSVVEMPIIPISAHLTSHALPTSSSAASGNCYFPQPSSVDGHKQDARVLKDNIVPFGPTTPCSLVSSSSVSGDIVYRTSGPSATLTQRQGEQSRKDKGMSVATTPIVQAPANYTPRVVSGIGGQVMSPPAVENHEADDQRRKDKGKMVVETPIIDTSTVLTSHMLPTSSSAASGTCYLLGPSVVHSHEQCVQAKKDNVVASGPTTPRSLVSSSTVSGTDGKEKMGLIIYNQRRSSRSKKIGAGSISFPFSCPPPRRTKKKGVELDGGLDGHSGSHTDPLPLPKKKRARNEKHEFVHAMPQDEVERLKALYADIDAFELVEEVAAETELD